MSRVLYTGSQRWYYRLKPSKNDQQARGLLEDYPLEKLEGHLVVCFITQSGIRLFSYFDSYIEFALFMKKVLPEKRGFYEVIFGSFPQKPHFDLDISQSDLFENEDLDQVATDIVETVISGIFNIFSQLGISLFLEQDVLLYTSHGPDKRSIHLVINNYCHLNHHEARALRDQVYKYCVECLKDKYSPSRLDKWIDGSVYSETQQFRMVGSQKTGSNRPKIFLKEWTFFNRKILHRYVETPDNPDHENVLQLEESLISNTQGCAILPNLLSTSPHRRKFGKIDDVSDEVAQKALEECARFAKISVTDPQFPYRISAIRGAVIILKRIKPSFCPICSRIHEHENPYLFIHPSGTVFFHCRRAPKHAHIPVGTLDSPQTHFKKVGRAFCQTVRERLLALNKEISKQKSEKCLNLDLDLEKVNEWFSKCTPRAKEKDKIHKTKSDKTLDLNPDSERRNKWFAKCYITSKEKDELHKIYSLPSKISSRRRLSFSI